MRLNQSIYGTVLIAVLGAGAWAEEAPFQIFLTGLSSTSVTFVRAGHPEHYLGYRIVEHEPEVTEAPLSDYADQPQRRGYPPPDPPGGGAARPVIPAGQYTGDWRTQHDGDGFVFDSFAGGYARFRYKEGPGVYRVVVLRAAADGVDVWAWLETDREIPGSYVVQACFRLSGHTNEEWRHRIALVPALSEYDRWASGDLRSLTYVRRNDAWEAVPAVKKQVDCWTSAGAALFLEKNKIDEETLTVAHGLIVRESAEEKECAGMYWERITRLSNHHPADCLHAYVDLGPAKPGERHVVHGKFYWLDGDKDALLEHWRLDFGTGRR